MGLGSGRTKEGRWGRRGERGRGGGRGLKVGVGLSFCWFNADGVGVGGGGGGEEPRREDDVWVALYGRTDSVEVPFVRYGSWE